ncbi:hypothetical protein EYC80_007691 [Monilinia laxa]|uniref:Uncharacterized protein n=1 Tax=Monilinia laxa TaxID=61186 RepID=A0A5N6JWX8_MONLA|nr:hypothetical protein EYC80_007691 [Monilinia laxa]
MYIHLRHTLGSLGTQTTTFTRRAESAPTSIGNQGFWQVQFNFWGTILAFLAALGIITGLLTWCLVCRGKRIQKRLARAKEKEREEMSRNVERAVGNDWVHSASNDAPPRIPPSNFGAARDSYVRKSIISHPSPYMSRADEDQKDDFERDQYGYNANWGMDKEMGIEMGTGLHTPVPSYHSRDDEKEEIVSELSGDIPIRGDVPICGDIPIRGSVYSKSDAVDDGAKDGQKEAWHRIEANGTAYMGRERGHSAYMEEKDIRSV